MAELRRQSSETLTILREITPGIEKSQQETTTLLWFQLLRVRLLWKTEKTSTNQPINNNKNTKKNPKTTTKQTKTTKKGNFKFNSIYPKKSYKTPKRFLVESKLLWISNLADPSSFSHLVSQSLFLPSPALQLEPLKDVKSITQTAFDHLTISNAKNGNNTVWQHFLILVHYCECCSNDVKKPKPNR